MNLTKDNKKGFIFEEIRIVFALNYKMGENHFQEIESLPQTKIF